MGTLTAKHWKLFEAWSACDDGTGFHFKALEQRTGLLRNEIRPLVHDLAAEGYLSFMRGCFTEEGEPYGSAYVLTIEGWNALRTLPAKENARHG